MIVNSGFAYTPTFSSAKINISKHQLETLRKQNYTLNEIANELHVSCSRVSAKLKEYGLCGDKQVNYNDFDKKILCNLINQGKTIKEIAEQLGTTFNRVRSLLRHFKLQTTYASHRMITETFPKDLENSKIKVEKARHKRLFLKTHDAFLSSIEKEDLVELLNNKHSKKDIAIMFDTSVEVINKLISKFGI